MLVELEDAKIAALQQEDRVLAKKIDAQLLLAHSKLSDRVSDMLGEFIESGGAAELIWSSLKGLTREIIKELLRQKDKDFGKPLGKESEEDIKKTLDGLSNEEIERLHKVLLNLGVSAQEVVDRIHNLLVKWLPSYVKDILGWRIKERRPFIRAIRARQGSGLGLSMTIKQEAEIRLPGEKQYRQLVITIIGHSWTDNGAKATAVLDKWKASHDLIYHGMKYPGHGASWDFEYQFTRAMQDSITVVLQRIKTDIL